MGRERMATPHGPGSGLFATTHWSVVLAAAGREQPPGAAQALEELCRIYWPPIYWYIRRRGIGPEDAQDLTQEFFSRLLARDRLAQVNPSRGKFRSFLLASVNHMLSDERDRGLTQKRGGGRPVLPFDPQMAEDGYRLQAADELTPERLFERRWALSLVEGVLSRLQQEFSDTGKVEPFKLLKLFLTGSDEPPSYAAAADRLHMTPGAVRVAVHRLRLRFGELFREAVAQTVAAPEEIEPEMRYLLDVLSA